MSRPLLRAGQSWVVARPARAVVVEAQPDGPEVGKGLQHLPPRRPAVLSAEGCSESAVANVYRVRPFRNGV